MQRRTGGLVGLVLLATMVLALAETVWAATCAPEMGTMAATAAMDGMGEMPADDHCLRGHHPDKQPADEDGTSCPFAPGGAAQGCTAAALMPDAGVAVASPTPTEMMVAISAETTPHLLRTASIFHPPKA